MFNLQLHSHHATECIRVWASRLCGQEIRIVECCIPHKNVKRCFLSFFNPFDDSAVVLAEPSQQTQCLSTCTKDVIFFHNLWV